MVLHIFNTSSDTIHLSWKKFKGCKGDDFEKAKKKLHFFLFKVGPTKNCLLLVPEEELSL